MKKHLHSHVVDVLFNGKDVPHKSNQRFWPSSKSIRSNIKRQLRKQQRSMIDQECLLQKIQEWKNEDPSVRIHYRPKKNSEDGSEDQDDEEDEEEDEDDEEDGGEEVGSEMDDEEDDEEDEGDDETAEDDSDSEDGEDNQRVKVKAKLNNSLLFVYQTEEMRRLLKR